MWIESHKSLANHPKLRRLCRTLGCSRREAIGTLHLLWWWAIEYQLDGDLTLQDPADLAEACDWTGRPDDLLAALVACRFLERDRRGDELLIHDWSDYAGHLHMRRLANRRRQAALRERARASVQANALRLLPSDTESRATGPDRTGPDQPDRPDQPPLLASGGQHA